MKKYDVVLLTESRYLRPTKVDWYVQNILTEDEMATNALRSKGLRVHRVDWADPDFDWTSTSSALFRTTWDYFHRFGEFSQWLNKVENLTQLINPAKQVKWNLDKHYLLDLNKSGVHIPQSLFLEVGYEHGLEEAYKQCGWDQAILKPAISGAARHTYVINAESIHQYRDVFDNLIRKEALMLQPFLHNVVSHGEIAFMLFGGKFSHAILKKAKDGDFRVQDDFGGTVHDYKPTQQEIEFAEQVISVVSPIPVYARLDVVFDNQNQLTVSELELIEPELWFRNFPESANMLAEQVVKML